jgi:hypothetical protein
MSNIKRVVRVKDDLTLQIWGDGRPLYRGGYKSMIPRFSAIVTACVRSLAPSLERMFLT